MGKINVVVVGTGYGGRTILPVLSRFGDVKIRALVGGTRHEYTRDIARQYGVECWDKTYDEVVRDGWADLVFIASPHEYHGEMVRIAIESDANIVCEKPLSCDLEEIQQIISLADRSPKRIRVMDLQLPYHPQVQQLRKAVKSGDMGNPYYFRINFRTDRLVHPTARWCWWFEHHERGGGMLTAMGSHLISLAEFCMSSRLCQIGGQLHFGGEQVKRSDGRYKVSEAESGFAIQMQLENGIRVDIFCTGVSYNGTTLECSVFGNKGEISLSSDGALRSFWFAGDGTRKHREITAEVQPEVKNSSLWEQAFYYLADDVIRSVGFSGLPNEDLSTDFSKYARLHRIVETVRFSNNANCMVDVRDMESGK